MFTQRTDANQQANFRRFSLMFDEMTELYHQRCQITQQKALTLEDLNNQTSQTINDISQLPLGKYFSPFAVDHQPLNY